MKLMMISTDRALFDPDSPVRARILEQAALVDELSVIVFAPKSAGYKDIRIAQHVIIHPTNSLHKFFYMYDAFYAGRRILKDALGKWLITTQDPFETGAVGFLLSRFYHAPLHVQLHTDPFSAAWKTLDHVNTFRAFLAAAILHRAEGVRVVSERAKRGVLHVGVSESKITKVPIFVDVEKFIGTDASFDLHHSYPDYGHIVVSMGRLTREKNFAGLLQAFKKICEHYHDALLLIVGSGPERERLITLAQSLGIDEHVHFLPWARDVASYYKTADVYVQSSLYEGWGLAVIEALASGAPVVMTDVGCAGEIVINGENGVVVPVGDDNALADGINSVLGSEALRKKFAEHGKEAVSHLATKLDTLKLYKESWEKAFEVRKNKK